MYIDNKEFKQLRINHNYFISKDGEVYSTYSNRLLKPLIRGKGKKVYLCVDIWFDGSQKHMPIHRLVYDTWVEPITINDNINHYDDNQFNNSVENLYKGNQKENIKKLTVYDYQENKQLTFNPSSDFIEYCKHPSKNGSVKKFFNKDWFKKRFKVIEFTNIHSISEK